MKLLIVDELISHSIAVLCALLVVNVASCDNGRDSGGRSPVPPKIVCNEYAKAWNVTWQQVVIPHEKDCTKFYQCFDNKTNELVAKQCADRVRTRYDPYSRICEWNHKIDCVTWPQWAAKNAI